MKGAALKAAMGTPRSSVFHISASVPPTSVMGAEKAIPAIARVTRSVAMFLATAPGIVKMTASSKVLAYIGLLPTISLSGANTIGPNQHILVSFNGMLNKRTSTYQYQIQ